VFIITFLFQVQTVWFFEKPEARARDETAVYEGNIVEQWIDVTSTSSTASSILHGGAAGCLGGRGTSSSKSGGSVSKKGGGGSLGKKTGKRVASLRKKNPDDAGDDVKTPDDLAPEKNGPGPSSEDGDKHHLKSNHNCDGDHPSRAIPSGSQDAGDSAGWEATIRSMGEKGWELASVVNALDSQVVSGKHKVKVLLIFQRKISLTFGVKGRRTSDGLQLR
jgi:hypothetical protein